MIAAAAQAGWRSSSFMPPVGALRTAAGAVRGHVRSVLADWGIDGEVAENFELVVDEVVSNAVNASTDKDGRPKYTPGGLLPVIQLCLYSDGPRLLAEVWDQAPGVPEPRPAVGLAESGRGLWMIGELGAKCGWYPVGDHKCVWAEMPV